MLSCVSVQESQEEVLSEPLPCVSCHVNGIATMALFDTGAAGNAFIDPSLACEFSLPLFRLKKK